MVGVPGRSTACHNCRQRKIKCDGGTPGCENCAKSKRLCLGYRRERTFILSSNVELPESSSSSPATSTSISKDGASGPVLVSRWRKPRPSAPAGASAAAAGPPAQLRTADSCPKTPVPRQVSSRHAFRQQLLATYFSAFLPDDVLQFSNRLEAKNRNWILQIPDLVDITPALEAAVLGCCTARIGALDGHPGLLHQSLVQYNKSLRQLQRDLCHPALRSHDQTLAACMALTLFEFTECPQGLIKAYQSHYSGAMELLQRRGPELHSSGLGHSVLRALRNHTIFQSLVVRRPSFLADKEWIDIPWANQRKDLHDQLIDIFLAIPQIHAQTDAARAEERPIYRLIGSLKLAQTCWDIDLRLRQWFDRLDSSTPGPLFWPELSTFTTAADTPDSGKLFPVAYRFPVFIVAQTLIYYWTASALVAAHLTRLYQALQQHAGQATMMLRQFAPCTCDDDDAAPPAAEGAVRITTCVRHFKFEDLPPLGLRQDWGRSMAYEICRSAEYFLDKRMRCLGPACLFTPLRVLRFLWDRTPGNWTRELAWINDTIKRVQERGHFIARYAQTDEGLPW